MWKSLSLAGAMFLVLITATDAVAQRRPPPPPSPQTSGAARDQADRASFAARSRLDSEIERRGRQVSPEIVIQSAQIAATASGASCQVREALFLGTTSEDHELYEAACSNGAGYLLQVSTPPKAFDCLIAAAQAATAERAAGPVCSIPANSAAAIAASHARDAGVTCSVDAGKFVGATGQGNPVYEIGCANADGYHIEKTAQGWSKTDCLQIMATNLTCEFTSAEEQAAGFKPLLVGTDISDCDAQGVRLLAQNDTGRFIEIKCAAGEGYVARVKDDAIGQVIPCNRAQRIGSGCTMTPVPVAANEQ